MYEKFSYKTVYIIVFSHSNDSNLKKIHIHTLQIYERGHSNILDIATLLSLEQKFIIQTVQITV